MRWLRRIRHRRGYGIHSPFAFGFVTDVVYSPGVFYAYDELKKLHRNVPHAPLRLKDMLFLFRLANFLRPATCRLVNMAHGNFVEKTISAGSRHTAILPTTENAPAILTIAANWEDIAEKLVSQLPDEGVIVLTHPCSSRRRRNIWRDITCHSNARVTFDIGDFGIIFNKPELFPQNYIINYY